MHLGRACLRSGMITLVRPKFQILKSVYEHLTAMVLSLVTFFSTFKSVCYFVTYSFSLTSTCAVVSISFVFNN